MCASLLASEGCVASSDGALILPGGWRVSLGTVPRAQSARPVRDRITCARAFHYARFFAGHARAGALRLAKQHRRAERM